MKIESSMIEMNSYYYRYKAIQKSEKLIVKSEKNQNNQLNNMSIFNENRKLDNLTYKPKKEISELTKYKKSEDLLDFNEDPKLYIMKFLFEKVFGIKLNLFSEDDFKELKEITNFSIELSEKIGQFKQNSNNNWSFEFSSKTLISEEEISSFKSTGIIKTKDNKEFAFTLNAELSRKFIIENEINIKIANSIQKDPLVINYDGNSSNLTENKFKFDLDSDGEFENMSFVNNGSGFLALDKNEDGKINNGKELFGVESGDGLKDLSAYDEDKNQWIDENDKVYNKLGIYSKDMDGNDSLFKLKSKSIGALYLKSVSLPFEYNDNNFNKIAESKAMGIFLKDDGKIGTVQQIDLVV